MTDQNDKLDELLRKTKVLQAQSAAVTNKSPADLTKAVETINNVAEKGTKFAKALGPFGKAAWHWGTKIWNVANAIWTKTSRKTYPQPGLKGKFKRASAVAGRGVVLAAMATVAIGLIPGMLGDVVWNVTVKPAATAVVDTLAFMRDSIRISLFLHKDTPLYLNRDSQGSQDQEDHTYRVSAMTGDKQNSFKLTIHDGVLHSLWNSKANGSPLYNPDVVATKIPAGETTLCKGTWYGSYNKVLLYLGSKPILLEAKCNIPAIQQAAAPAPTPG